MLLLFRRGWTCTRRASKVQSGNGIRACAPLWGPTDTCVSGTGYGWQPSPSLGAPIHYSSVQFGACFGSAVGRFACVFSSRFGRLLPLRWLSGQPTSLGQSGPSGTRSGSQSCSRESSDRSLGGPQSSRQLVRRLTRPFHGLFRLGQRSKCDPDISLEFSMGPRGATTAQKECPDQGGGKSTALAWEMGP
jgi:hypothetical protein